MLITSLKFIMQVYMLIQIVRTTFRDSNLDGLTKYSETVTFLRNISGIYNKMKNKSFFLKYMRKYRKYKLDEMIEKTFSNNVENEKNEDDIKMKIYLQEKLFNSLIKNKDWFVFKFDYIVKFNDLYLYMFSVTFNQINTWIEKFDDFPINSKSKFIIWRIKEYYISFLNENSENLKNNGATLKYVIDSMVRINDYTIYIFHVLANYHKIQSYNLDYKSYLYENKKVDNKSVLYILLKEIDEEITIFEFSYKRIKDGKSLIDIYEVIREKYINNVRLLEEFDTLISSNNNYTIIKNKRDEIIHNDYEYNKQINLFNENKHRINNLLNYLINLDNLFTKYQKLSKQLSNDRYKETKQNKSNIVLEINNNQEKTSNIDQDIESLKSMLEEIIQDLNKKFLKNIIDRIKREEICTISYVRQ